MKQEPFTIQIGRRIVLREARRMRDSMRRRKPAMVHGLRSINFSFLRFSGIYRSRIACPFESFKISRSFITYYVMEITRKKLEFFSFQYVRS